MKNALILLSGLVALPLVASALEMSTQGLQGPQASVNVINSKMDSLAATTNAALNKIQTCNVKGMFYDPTNKKSDSDDCFSGEKTCNAKNMFYDPSNPKADSDGCFNGVLSCNDKGLFYNPSNKAADKNGCYNGEAVCDAKNMFYDPTNKNADADGCYNGVKVCSAKGMYFDPSRAKAQTDADSCFAMVPDITRRVDNEFTATGWVTARAQCASDEVVVGGGFWCSGPDMGKSYAGFSGPYVTAKGGNDATDTPNAWNAGCLNNWNGTSVRAISFVYCMKMKSQTSY